MIKEALEFFMESTKPAFFDDQDGNSFSDKKMYPVEKQPPKKTTLTMKTLSSLMAFVNHLKIDSPDLLIHVESERAVYLYNGVDVNMDKVYCVAKAYYSINSNIGNISKEEQESFIAILATRFQPSDDQKILINLVSSLTKIVDEKYKDDGITLSYVKQKGLHLKESSETKSIFDLVPYYTFPEIEQPTIKYLLRVSENKEFSLLPVFDERYNVDLMSKIKDYFSNCGVVVV